LIALAVSLPAMAVLAYGFTRNPRAIPSPLVGRPAPDASLDLVRDMGNDLHGVTQIVAAAFLLDDGLVHRAGGHVGVAPEVLTGESFVVAEIEVGFSAIVGDEDLTMLERVHRPRVDVDVRVQLLVDDFQSPGFEESAER